MPRRTAFFFGFTLLYTWALQLPAALARLELIPGGFEAYMPLVALGAFGPVLGATVAAYRESGRSGVRSLFASLGNFRVGLGWFPVALFGFGALYVIGAAVYRLTGIPGDVPWLYPPESAEHWIAMVLFPLVEEPGWRGYALPRRLEQVSPLRASFEVGAVWAAWHTMMFIAQGVTPWMFVVSAVNILAGSVLFTWLYRRTGGSLLMAVIAHAGAHLNNPGHAVPGNELPFVIYTVVLLVAAGVVSVAGRMDKPPSGGSSSRA